MKLIKLLAVVLALFMFATACGSDGVVDAVGEAAGDVADTAGDVAGDVADTAGDVAEDVADTAGDVAEDVMEGDDDGGAMDDTDEDVALSQGSDLTFHMITHSDDGIFWSVVKKGMEAACDDVGVSCVWNPGVNDANQMVSDIEAALASGTDGIAASLPDPSALVGPLQQAVAEGVPVVTLNSGLNQYKDIGALTHVGQAEFIAGQAAGERFNAAGVSRVLCGYQEQGNIGLEERCNGLADTFAGDVLIEFVGLDADPTDQLNGVSTILDSNSDIDGFLGTGPVVAMTGLTAATELGRDVMIGGFDLSTDILDEIEAGNIAFTVDQQQYLQGYLPIVLMYLERTNANVAGGGQPVLTGPGFVDGSNAGTVKALAAQGTR